MQARRAMFGRPSPDDPYHQGCQLSISEGVFAATITGGGSVKFMFAALILSPRVHVRGVAGVRSTRKVAHSNSIQMVD